MKLYETFSFQRETEKNSICHAQSRMQMRIFSASPARCTTMSRQASAPPNWRMFPFVSAQLLREISLLSNPSKTPALGKASVSKAEPSTAAFETRRRKIHWIFLRHAWQAQARLRANIFRAGASPYQSKKHSPNSREPLYNRD